jgi:catechol 2,3-dioxygenase-like lactoylglutathione lyase family enzyme
MQLAQDPWEDTGPGQSGIGLGVEAYGVDPASEIQVRFAFLRFPGDPNSTMIDLLEYINPRPVGGPPSTLLNVGLARIAIKVEDVPAAYEELLQKGVKFITPPVTVAVLDDISYCCFYDPDGTILEIYSEKQ